MFQWLTDEVEYHNKNFLERLYEEYIYEKYYPQREKQINK